MQHTAEANKQYQCRHIFTDGRRCASPCLRREEFCYYHHTTRKPVADAAPAPQPPFHLRPALARRPLRHPALHRRSPPPHRLQRHRPPPRRPAPLRPPDRQPQPPQTPTSRKRRARPSRPNQTRRRDHHRPHPWRPRPTHRDRHGRGPRLSVVGALLTENIESPSTEDVQRQAPQRKSRRICPPIVLPTHSKHADAHLVS